MSNSVLPSTLLLTVLLTVGLVFFIRASVKDRTQVAILVSDQPEESLLAQMQQYFAQRAYQVATVDAANNQVTLEGVVRPSVFLATFLTLLAAVGILCLSLVLSILFPSWMGLWFSLVALAPGAGWFYWWQAKRPEQVTFKLSNATPGTVRTKKETRSVVQVTAHRDELLELQRTLQLERCD